jgi:hypothetical protein
VPCCQPLAVGESLRHGRTHTDTRRPAAPSQRRSPAADPPTHRPTHRPRRSLVEAQLLEELIQQLHTGDKLHLVSLAAEALCRLLPPQAVDDLHLLLQPCVPPLLAIISRHRRVHTPLPPHPHPHPHTIHHTPTPTPHTTPTHLHPHPSPGPLPRAAWLCLAALSTQPALPSHAPLQPHPAPLALVPQRLPLRRRGESLWAAALLQAARPPLLLPPNPGPSAASRQSQAPS